MDTATRRSKGEQVPNDAAVSPIVDLHGKIGVITGMANSSSIAYGAAAACRRAGAELAISYQTAKTKKYTEPLAKALRARIYQRMDVMEPGSLEALFETVRQTYGRLDFVIHSMAFAPHDDLQGRLVDCSAAGLNLAMEVSCHSFIRMARLAESLMPAGGCLLTMSYYGAEKVVEHYGMMGMVKAALESASRYMAAELGPKGIRVHAVSPGPMPTRAASGLAQFDQLMHEASSRAPLQRLVNVDEVGALCAFLVSDAAKSMTGSVIYIDAGYNILG